MKKEFNNVPVRERVLDYQCPVRDIKIPESSSLVLTWNEDVSDPFLDWSDWTGDSPWVWSIFRSNPDGSGVVVFRNQDVVGSGRSFPILNAVGDFLYWIQGFNQNPELGGPFVPATPFSNKVLIPKPVS